MYPCNRNKEDLKGDWVGLFPEDYTFLAPVLTSRSPCCAGRSLPWRCNHTRCGCTVCICLNHQVTQKSLFGESSTVLSLTSRNCFACQQNSFFFPKSTLKNFFCEWDFETLLPEQSCFSKQDGQCTENSYKYSLAHRPAGTRSFIVSF